MVFPLKYFIRSAFPKKIPGKRPVVVIESDDWGTIRMKSKEVYNKLFSENPDWVNDPYLTYDAIECNQDIESLLDVLKRHRDGDGNHPVITANCVGGNPDFAKIRENKFGVFFWEDFRQTLSRYPDSDQVFKMEQQGLQEGIFVPQFHAREHIQTGRWLKSLSEGNADLRRAFDHELISHALPGQNTCASFFMDAFNADNRADLDRIISNCREGLKLFKDTWGFNSLSMIAPCYYWHPELEKNLLAEGVRAFQGLRVQKVSRLNNQPSDFIKSFHYNGEQNKNGQFYFVRNCFFEPSLNPGKWGTDGCLKQVEAAFRHNGVAIISAHRLNFIGRIDPSNRTNNLRSFDDLLGKIVNRYPSVKFLSTPDLLNLYSGS
jgi:hypothetical protein